MNVLVTGGIAAAGIDVFLNEPTIDPAFFTLGAAYFNAANFPKAIEVLDRTGRTEYRVADLPLNEGEAIGGVRPGPRQVAWRADHPATLSWIQSLDRNGTPAAAASAPCLTPAAGQSTPCNFGS